MKTYIALLRGVNVGGHNQIRMAALKKLCEDLGCQAVETYVNSGNVVFRSSEEDGAALTRHLQAGLHESLGLDAPILIREPQDLARILTSNPFLSGQEHDPTKLHVMFLFGPADPARLAALVKPPQCEEEYAVGEQEIYLFYPNGLGRATLGKVLTERKLGVLTTTRNWNTVNALYRMSQQK